MADPRGPAGNSTVSAFLDRHLAAPDQPNVPVLAYTTFGCTEDVSENGFELARVGVSRKQLPQGLSH